MKRQPIYAIVKSESFKNIILVIIAILALWAILAIQFEAIPVIKICASEKRINALNSLYLTLSYSYIAAFVFYYVTHALPTRQRKDILEPIIQRKVSDISRCIRDILLEFHRGTDFHYDVHSTADTEALLRCKDWFAIIPFIQKYQKVSISYLNYMKLCGGNH